MARRFYTVTRDLHLYAGLFLSPFVLVFAASVFLLVHPDRSAKPQPGHERVVADVAMPADLERLNGREQLDALRPLLDSIGVHGEMNFIRRIAKEHRLVIPVMLPGRETTVDLDLVNRSARVSERVTGLADAVIHLHKMPGPHNVNMRGNSAYMRAWRWLADGTVYGLLFLTLSGLYLWAVLRAERRVGLALLAAGGLSFAGLIHAVIH